jgi:glycosyltransferase involved in cell wall biosynthesis
MSRFGVALCTYNGARYLREQLESIAAQTRRPDLVLACDDGSKDGTVEQLEAWAAQVPFEVRIVRNPANLGYLRNFEQAIAKCDADLIVLSDQDDEWHPEKLQRMEAFFLANADVGGVFSDAEIVDEQLATYGYGLMDALHATFQEREAVRQDNLFPVLLRRNLVAGATLAFRRSWSEIVLPIPGAAVHDEWIALIIAAFGGLRFIPERLIKYRQHSTNQIGARRLTVKDRLRLLLLSRRAQNQRVLDVMRELHRRLAGLPEAQAAGVLPEIQRKVEHMSRRVSLAQRRLLRVPLVIAETANGGYFRYSSGWRAVTRDLLSPM